MSINLGGRIPIIQHQSKINVGVVRKRPFFRLSGQTKFVITDRRRLSMINYASSEDAPLRLRIADNPMPNKPGSTAAGVGTAVSLPPT